jgi:MEMO1 family protein
MSLDSRPMRFAGSWYPEDPDDCRAAIAEYRARSKPRRSPPLPPGEGKGEGPSRRAVAAVCPHAGWFFSGPTAVLTIDALAAGCDKPDTVILFGAVHHGGVDTASVWPSGEWQTPLGPARVDNGLADAVIEAGRGRIRSNREAHLGEHSIEVLMPFIRAAFPDAAILPIAAPPDAGMIEVGSIAAFTAKSLGRAAVAVGSTDMTHYGMDHFGWAPAGRGPRAVKWAAEENDPPFLDALARLDASAALDMQRDRRNSCGPGAVAATISFAREMGAKRGVVVDYSTSLDAEPGRAADNFVTYGGVVFEA